MVTVGRGESVCICDSNSVSVCVECRTVAAAELREGRAVLARERDFFLGNVRWLEVEDSVGWPGPNGGVHVLCVQLLPDLFAVLDRSNDEEAQDLVAKPALDCFLFIPGTRVRGDPGI